MNNGDNTAYYLYRAFSVVAVEADLALVTTASERFKREIAIGRLKVLNVAIAKEPGVLPFWICETNPEFKFRSPGGRRLRPLAKLRGDLQDLPPLPAAFERAEAQPLLE
jgi:hypothetical protein